MFGDGLENKDGIRSFLMIGQPNMAGRGELSEVEPIRNSLLHSMQKELPRCRVVKAKELPPKPEGIHFNSASCRELGIRYFEAYKEIH